MVLERIYILFCCHSLLTYFKRETLKKKNEKK